MSLPAFRPSVGAMREARMRDIRESERLLGIKAQVRSDMRAERRLRAVAARLQPLFDRLEASLHDERREARGEASADAPTASSVRSTTWPTSSTSSHTTLSRT
jgi:hypothetical protein